jgi:hypothetical protein
MGDGATRSSSTHRVSVSSAGSAATKALSASAAGRANRALCAGR